MRPDFPTNRTRGEIARCRRTKLRRNLRDISRAPGGVRDGPVLAGASKPPSRRINRSGRCREEMGGGGHAQISRTDGPRRSLPTEQHIQAVIPLIGRRKPWIPHDCQVYRQVCSAAGRVATRHDKIARNFLAGVLIAATVTWWLS